MTTPSTDAPACHICGAPGLDLIAGYPKLSRVTSDCKSWPAGGRLAVCRQCGCTQVALDQKWHEDVANIYGAYAVYHQAQGAEQNVFDAASGKPISRSDYLVGRFQADGLLPKKGRMMDFGCGNGRWLKSFGAVFKDWTMAGLDLSYDRREEIESIPGVEGLFTPPLKDVPGSFDFITLIHCLEHIENPLACLAEVRDKLTPGGVLSVQLPDCGANPFSFLVADHATHFCLPAAQRLVQNAGFEILVANNQWVARELTIVARKQSSLTPPVWSDEGCMKAAMLTASVVWLENLAREARRLSQHKPFGVFGTSIGGTFLSGELGEAVDFYVDEDPGRQGQVFAGRPIYAPSQVPAGSHIYVGIAPVTAAKIIERMKSQSVRATFYAPPPLPAV